MFDPEDFSSEAAVVQGPIESPVFSRSDVKELP